MMRAAPAAQRTFLRMERCTRTPGLSEVRLRSPIAASLGIKAKKGLTAAAPMGIPNRYRQACLKYFAPRGEFFDLAAHFSQIAKSPRRTTLNAAAPSFLRDFSIGERPA